MLRSACLRGVGGWSLRACGEASVLCAVGKVAGVATKGMPAHIHVASVIASQVAVDYVARTFPQDRTSIWVGAVDPVINEHSYIVPGLGDSFSLYLR